MRDSLNNIHNKQTDEDRHKENPEIDSDSMDDYLDVSGNSFLNETESSLNDSERTNRIVELRRIASEQMGGEYLTDEQIADDALSAQISVNRSGADLKDQPKMVSVMEEPLAEEDMPSLEEASNPGDRKKLKTIYLSLGSFIAAVLLISGTAFVVNQEDSPEQTVRGQSIVAGEEINNNDEGSQDSNSESSDNSSSSESASVQVPRGGSEVEYSITAEGNIGSVSVAWLDGSGTPDDQVNVALPWSKTVGARSSVSPMMKASSSGYGTLTCTITDDGEEIAEETVSGDSPEITCDS